MNFFFVGIPHPTVTWWRESVLVDETFSQTSQGYVRNELALPKLHRSDLLVTYSCQASNTNLTVPVSASVTININPFQCNNRILMAQRKHLDDSLRGRFIGRLECGRTQLEVSEEHGIAQSVISSL
ncbi:uncharacterized protein TNCV_1760661 [Trichonephila clavipes]|nr:uncharacterized protein TNCV_1760661 [Trichonephila clavipes]